VRHVQLHRWFVSDALQLHAAEDDGADAEHATLAMPPRAPGRVTLAGDVLLIMSTARL
jgi:hypothetical protein